MNDLDELNTAKAIARILASHDVAEDAQCRSDLHNGKTNEEINVTDHQMMMTEIA